ncbi:MAG: hypothetical protein GXP49_09285 [Deltaproteobacteria bacterium]|nr:hypothetical protein [Deltaproteobacteria bacterium]
MLKLKDYVTLMNGLCGFLSVVLVIRGQLVFASVLVFIGWAFDAMDGAVARLTKQHNKFGGELDNMCDMITWAMAPSFIVYAYYERFFSSLQILQNPSWLPWVLACVLGAMPITFGAVRFARFSATELKAEGYWIGLPRPVSAFIIVSFLNSHLFAHPLGPYVGIVLCFILFPLNMTLIPFISHHAGWWSGFLTGLMITVAGTSLAGLAAGFITGDFGFFFDSFFFWMTGYLFLAWSYIPARDWHKVRQDLAEWRHRELTG